MHYLNSTPLLTKTKLNILMNQNIKYQNYQHFKIPITMNPIEYGRLITKTNNLFIIQINKTNIALIEQHDDLNKVKLFKEGILMFEYTDHKKDENIFIRSLRTQKFTFENSELTFISTEKSVRLIPFFRLNKQYNTTHELIKKC